MINLRKLLAAALAFALAAAAPLPAASGLHFHGTAGAGFSFTSFDTFNAGASYVYSNGNLTVTNATSGFSALSLATRTSANTSVQRFEVHMDTFNTAVGNAVAIGVANGSWVDGAWPGGGTNGCTLDPGGSAFYNAVGIGTGVTVAVGDWITVEFNTTNSQIRFSKNGGAFSGWLTCTDGSTTLAGTFRAVVATASGGTSMAITANFGASAWNGPAIGAAVPWGN